MKEVIMTSEGYKKLLEELEYLKTEGRDQAAEKIRVARGFGDLSENTPPSCVACRACMRM